MVGGTNLSGPLAGSFHVVTEAGPKGNIGVMPFREAVSSLDIANMFAGAWIWTAW